MQPEQTKDKEALAKVNVEETKTAHQMAAEQRQRDIQAGEKPPVVAVADSIRSKLENQEFQKPETPEEAKA